VPELLVRSKKVSGVKIMPTYGILSVQMEQFGVFVLLSSWSVLALCNTVHARESFAVIVEYVGLFGVCTACKFVFFSLH